MPTVLRQFHEFDVTMNAPDLAVAYTFPVPLLDATKAAVFMTLRSDGNQPRQCQVRNSSVTGTQAVFSRIEGVGTINIHAYMVEWLSGVTVERGQHNVTEPEQTIPLSTITNLSKSFVYVTHSNGGVVYDADNTVAAWLVDNVGTIEVHLHAGSSGIFPEVNWQVVQYDDCTVQRGSITTMGDNLSATAAITSVNVAKSLLLYSHRNEFESALAGEIAVNMLRGVKTSPTLLTFTRDSAGSGATKSAVDDIRWQVVTFTDTCIVEEVLVHFNAAEGTKTPSVTPVSSTGRTLTFPTGSMATGECVYIGDDIPGEATFTTQLTAPNTLSVQRNSTIDAADVAVSVWQLPPPSAPPPGGFTGVGLAPDDKRFIWQRLG